MHFKFDNVQVVPDVAAFSAVSGVAKAQLYVLRRVLWFQSLVVGISVFAVHLFFNM